MTVNRCGQLRKVLCSPHLALKTKLKLYGSAVISLLTYGCESWDLSKKATRQIVGANSRMLAWFTGKTIPQEARPSTTSFNVLLRIRRQRLKWVGHLLRAGPAHLSYQALRAQIALGKEGNLLQDAPPFDTMQELQYYAMDRAAWDQRVANSL